MKDPVEHYPYPEDWVKRESERLGAKSVRKRVESGLYIITHRGWLRRGITTGTAASASAAGAISSLFEDVSRVKVWTPAGIDVEVDVNARNGNAHVRKFSGDHSFDVTDGIEIRAKISESPEFGHGVGRINGRASVSRSAMEQLLKNLEVMKNRYGYEGGVKIWIPDGEKVSQRTGNRKFGIKGGISILGTTGFVEPWCDELVESKIRIARQYDRVVLTTGRKGWRWARENLRNFMPFVMGLYFERALERLDADIIIAGLPSLLVKWAFPEMRGTILKGKDLSRFRDGILRKARQINPNVSDVVLLADD